MTQPLYIQPDGARQGLLHNAPPPTFKSNHTKFRFIDSCLITLFRMEHSQENDNNLRHIFISPANSITLANKTWVAEYWRLSDLGGEQRPQSCCDRGFWFPDLPVMNEYWVCHPGTASPVCLSARQLETVPHLRKKTQQLWGWATVAQRSLVIDRNSSLTHNIGLSCWTKSFSNRTGQVQFALTLLGGSWSRLSTERELMFINTSQRPFVLG